MANKRGAPKGNQNAVRHKIWAEAIRMEVVSKKKLRVLARKLVKMAEEGDMAAMKEIGDRLEGKPQQSIAHSGEDGGDIPISVTVKYVGNDSKPTSKT